MLDEISTRVPAELSGLEELEARLGAVVAELERIDSPGRVETVTAGQAWRLVRFVWQAESVAAYARALADGITQQSTNIMRLTHGISDFEEESAAA